MTSSSQLSELANENKRLKETLNQLVDSANHNQKTQEKFSDLELYFLESSSYEYLIKRILVDLKDKLRLTQVELLLMDTNGDIRLLIHEIYGELEYHNLLYINSEKLIKAFYPNNCLATTLSQDTQLISQLYQGSPQLSQSVALLPLVRGSEIIGSLHLGSRNIERFKSGLATNFLQHLSSIISVCIENSLNQERYKHLSLVDLLTRTKNRRYFFQVLSKEIARSSRSKQAISCLFIDIDHFKQINDQHGHLIGDRALCEVANSINPLLRQSDILARFGGEEFTILLPNTKTQQAQEIAERIRQHVSKLKIKNDNDKVFRVTISVGVSTWQPGKDGLTIPQNIQEQLINLADNCVYQAKESGRNCVKFASIS